MQVEDTKTSKWYVEVALPNPNVEPVYRPLYGMGDGEGHLRVANEEHLTDILVDEILFFDTYIQAEDFAKNLNVEFGYFTRVMEYVT